MKKFNLVKSLTRVINNRKGLLILCLSLAVFGVESAWGYGENTSYVYNNSSEFSVSSWGESSEFALTVTNAACEIYLDASKSMSTAVDPLIIFQKVNDSWQKVKEIPVGDIKKNDFKTFGPYPMNQNATHIKFKGGSYKRTIKNVKITRVTTISANSSSLDFGATTPNAEVTKTISVSYNNTKYNQLISGTCTNDFFSVVSQEVGATGTTDITIKYKPTSVGEHSGTVTLNMNGKSTSFTVTGSCQQTYYFKADAQMSPATGGGTAYASFTDGSFSSSSAITNVTSINTSVTKTAYFKAEANTAADYNFVGWYSDKELTSRVTESATYNQDITSSATSESSPQTLTLYAYFVQTFIPEFNGGNKTIAVGNTNNEITFNHTSTTYPSASSSDNFYYIISDEQRLDEERVNPQSSHVIGYNSSTGEIIAYNAGTAKITFYQKEDNAKHIAKGQSSTYTITVSKIANTLSVANASPTMYVGDNLVNKISTNSDGTITTESTDASIAYFDVTNNRILAPNSESKSFNSKEVTITISQDETYKYTAESKTIKVTVKKWDNNIFINGSKDSYATSIYMDAQKAINLTATNTDYSGSLITATQTAGNTIATLNAAQTQVTSNHNLGDATWNVSQPENYKYKAANASFTIHVVKQAEETCYVKEDLNSDHEFSENWSMTWNDENAAKTLTFRAKCQAAWTYGLYVCQYINGSWSEAKEGAANTTYISYDDLSTSYQPFEITLNTQAKGVKFVKRGTLKRTVRDIRVARNTFLNAANVEITETSSHNPIHPNETGIGTLTINHSLANGGDLKVKWDNAKFTIGGKTAAEGINLGDKGCSTGVTKLAIEYVSQEADEHKTTVVIYNNVYRATATITGKTIKRDQNIQWNTDIMIIGQTVANAAQTTSIINGVVTYKSDDTDVIRVKADDNGKLTILEALQPGTANITAFSAGNEEYNDAQSSKEITVTDKQIQYITWNQSLMGLKMGDADVPLNASAYQPDSLNCQTGGQRPIVYSSANTAVVEIVSGNKLKIKGIGVTTVTASQAGGTDGDGHDFIAVTAEKKVVVRDPNAPCETYIYEQTSEVKFDLGWNAASHQTRTQEIDFHGKEPGFVNFDYKGEAHKVLFDYYEGTLSIEQYVNNQWVEVRNFGKPGTSGYTNTGDIALDRKATKMRVKAADGMGYMYFKDCRITLARYLEGATLSTFETKVGAPLTKTLTIKYSNISGPVTFSLSENSNFSISQESIEGECGGYGTTSLDITYTPTTQTIGEEATLTLADDIQKTYIVLKGNASVTPLHINWDIPDNNTCYTIQSVNLSAKALTDLNVEIPNFVWFSLAQNSTTGTLTGNTLTFDKAGNANVVAQTTGDPRYTPAQNIFKNWTVNLTPTEVVTKPEIDGDIVYGAQLTDLKLKDNTGAARNTVNQQSVEGTFAITGGDISSAGEKTITVTFTPANTDMYASCTSTVSVTIQKAEPDAIAHAGEIIYGAAVGTSILTNEGTTEGIWTWNDEEKEKVLEVGTHEGLNVHFTPTDKTNYNEIDGTVSLTVKKAPATLTWTNAPTSADVKDKLTYTATSNHSESAITYTITGGADCATIDANTGELTITKAGTITIQASQDASTHYEAATAIMVTTTLTGEFENVFSGDGDWNNPENWTYGVPTSDNPDIVVSGSLTISEPISVGGLTIEANGKVTIVGNGDLTVNGTSGDRETYGNLFVRNGGDVTISENANVKVFDFVVESSIGTQDGTSVSGQVKHSDRVIYTNGAYIDIYMDPNGKMDDTQWYGFTVPFPVDVQNGVARKEGDTFRKCTYGSDYMIAEYDMNQRLNTGKGWKYIKSGQLQPGQFYYITVNGDYNIYSFKAAESAITIDNTAELKVNGSGADANWNAVGNSTLTYTTISGEKVPAYVQTYVNGESRYITVATDDAQFVVGCPFFFQASEATTMILNEANETVVAHYAPRQESLDKPVCVRIAEKGKHFSDQIYLTTSQEATGEYTLGRDLAKAGIGTKSAQLWMNAYGQKLSVQDATLMGDQAYYELSIYAPKAGSYELSLPKIPANAVIYLTQNGYPIWNLNEMPYVIECYKGTTNEYGLLLRLQEGGSPTDMQTMRGSEKVQKIMKNQRIYINANSQLYDLMGQKVK